MNYKIVPTADFKSDFKQLYKKFPSLKREIEQLGISLESNPVQGTSIGKNCYKIRLAIRSKNTGKSDGARVITHVKIIEQTVYLLSIYNKSVQSTIADKEISERIRRIK
jgi:mRNA-degrading endonuclease RelE of RelBE toxin-antitoxin system